MNLISIPRYRGRGGVGVLALGQVSSTPLFHHRGLAAKTLHEDTSEGALSFDSLNHQWNISFKMTCDDSDEKSWKLGGNVTVAVRFSL